MDVSTLDKYNKWRAEGSQFTEALFAERAGLVARIQEIDTALGAAPVPPPVAPQGSTAAVLPDRRRSKLPPVRKDPRDPTTAQSIVLGVLRELATPVSATEAHAFVVDRRPGTSLIHTRSVLNLAVRRGKLQAVGPRTKRIYYLAPPAPRPAD